MKKVFFLMFFLAFFVSCGDKTEPEVDNSESGNDEETILDEDASDGESPDEDAQEEDYSDYDVSEEAKYILKNSVTVESLDNFDGFSDLEPLKELLKDKKIILLGENYHGVVESKKYKERMMAFLHKEMGINIFVGEIGWCNGKLIDQYIQTGDESYLAQTDVFDHMTYGRMIEAYGLYKTLRMLSEESSEGIRFIGMDIDHGRRVALGEIYSFLSVVDEELEESFRMKTETIYDSENFISYAEYQAECEALLVVFDERKDEFESKTSYNEYYEVHFILKNMIEGIKFYNSSEFQIREDVMMTNIDRIIAENSGPIVISANNIHTSFGDFMRPLKSLGSYIGQTYDNTYNIAMFCYDGQTFFPGSDGAVDIYETKEGDFEYFFHETGKDYLFLDWSFLDDSSDVWLNDYYTIRAYNKGGNPFMDWDSAFFINTVHPGTCCVEKEDFSQ